MNLVGMGLQVFGVGLSAKDTCQFLIGMALKSQSGFSGSRTGFGLWPLASKHAVILSYDARGVRADHGGCP